MVGQHMYLAGSYPGPEIVKMISLKDISDCRELSSRQEEEDTRIILHALNVDKLYRENGVNAVSGYGSFGIFNTLFLTNDSQI